MPEALRKANVTHPDRLFDIRQVPLTLSPEDALYALIEPAQRLRHVHWEPEAAGMIVDATNGYPAHLQLFADHAWRAAKPDADRITVADAQNALTSAAEELEERTLGPRLDRLTDRQAELLVAVAVHGGAVSTRDLTSTLHRESSTTYSRTRDELITEGDLYAPRRGALALTVPLMRPYLLAHYDEVCARANVAILPLRELERATGQLSPP
jgi:hypothetical protein